MLISEKVRTASVLINVLFFNLLSIVDLLPDHFILFSRVVN